MTKADRILEAVRRVGKNPTEVAPLLDITPQGLGQACKNGSLGSKKTYKLAELAKVNYEWLDTGKGEKETLRELQGIDLNKLTRIMETVERIASEGNYSPAVKSAATVYFYSLDDEEPPKKAVITYLDVQKAQKPLFPE